MNALEKFTITIDRCQTHEGGKTIYTDLRIWLRIKAKDEKGQSHISFLMVGEEGINLFAGRAHSLLDVSTHLVASGELWTIFSNEGFYYGEEAGTFPTNYRRITVPIPVQRFILNDIESNVDRYDQGATVRTKKYGEGTEREEIVLDYSDRLDEWGDYYGQFKGKLVVEGNASGELESLKGEESFDRSWLSISRLALSTTHSKGDEGIVRIHRESESSFLWQAGTMHGGLINHGSDEEPEWSVHT